MESSDENQNCGILLFFNPQRISAIDPTILFTKKNSSTARSREQRKSSDRQERGLLDIGNTELERSWGPERGIMENRRGGDDTVVTGGEAEIACEGEAAQDKHGGEGRKGQPELGKRKDRPPPTDPPPQKSRTSKNSKKNKPKKSSKKRKTTDEESPAVDFVGTVGVAEENEVEEPAKDVEDREKEKEESEKEKEREEENGDEDEEEEENSDESQEEKDENGDKDEEEEGNSDESQEEKDENGDKDEEEEGNSDEEVENKDEEKIQEEEDTGEEENGTPEENREPPLEAELGNVDGDGEGVLGQGEEMMEELIKQVKMFGTQLKRVKKTMDKFEERMVVPFEAFMKKAMDEGQGSREELVKWVLTRRITNSDLEAADLDEDGVVGAAEFILYN
ncbi:hypothetical protein HID58_033993 [Brassica napus]|uniref:Uncharacterized protein n=1 Tax=Brassica napus TaxID=3708 RepID=A0ABQ8C1S1_BRANA|nr:hypothetical protein HID58_033993 [Brassica napus]